MSRRAHSFYKSFTRSTVSVTARFIKVFTCIRPCYGAHERGQRGTHGSFHKRCFKSVKGKLKGKFQCIFASRVCVNGVEFICFCPHLISLLSLSDRRFLQEPAHRVQSSNMCSPTLQVNPQLNELPGVVNRVGELRLLWG